MYEALSYYRYIGYNMQHDSGASLLSLGFRLYTDISVNMQHDSGASLLLSSRQLKTRRMRELQLLRVLRYQRCCKSSNEL